MIDAAFHTSAKPVVAPYIHSRRNEDEFIVEANYTSYAFSGQSAQILSEALHRLNGVQDLGSIAEDLKVSSAQLGAILSILAEDGLIIDAAAAVEAGSQKDFFKSYFSECKFWSKNIFAQPFWSTLLAGQASQDLILGWGIEFFHYVNAANEHMAASVAYCRNGTSARQILAQHYVEEHDHGDIFLDGLVACGFNRNKVKAAPPLASTRALINFLSELATNDTLAYTGTFGVMQSAREETTVEAVNQFYDSLIAHYGYASGLLDAFRKHALIDVDLGHQELVLEQICAHDEIITREHAGRIITAVRDAAEHFILFFEGIFDYYGMPGKLIPRQSFDIRAVP